MAQIGRAPAAGLQPNRQPINHRLVVARSFQAKIGLHQDQPPQDPPDLFAILNAQGLANRVEDVAFARVEGPRGAPALEEVLGVQGRPGGLDQAVGVGDRRGEAIADDRRRPGRVGVHPFMGQDRARQLGEAVVVADREVAADLKEGFVPQARSVLSRQDQIVEATRAGAALLVQAIDRDVEGQGPMADAGDDDAQRVGDDEGL